MTKTPIHGLIKKRLSKKIGNCNSKRFTLLNIENIKKNLISKKKFKLYFYTTPLKNLEAFLIAIIRIFSFKKAQIWVKKYGM